MGLGICREAMDILTKNPEVLEEIRLFGLWQNDGCLLYSPYVAPTIRRKILERFRKDIDALERVNVLMT